MTYNQEKKKITIDLKKEEYNPGMLLEHKDVKFIRIDECTQQFELPLELADFPDLDTIYISGGNREILYDPPLNLEKLTNIRKLTLWSFCNLEKLSVMPHIEAFDVVIKDTFKDTRTIASLFPNLKKMEIWGSHKKEGELPPEIGSFKQLEYLELVSCGLTDLPPEFKDLRALRKLRTRGLITRKFPQVLGEMDWLEKLEFTQSITSLPANFSGLKSLKVLNFSHAFNKGTITPVDKWSSEKIYLHPIPEEIGKLPALEELDLSSCGVVDAGFLKGLKNLKKLKIKYSGLKNCDQLSACKNLTELNLEGSEVLEDINGLSGLPLQKLNLSSCDEIRSIAPILELKLLEELNIDDCDEIEDLTPIYNHPVLKKLNAAKAVIKQWELKEKFKNLPPIESVLNDLSSDAGGVFVKAVSDLKLYVDKNYHDQKNPLAGYFGQKADNYEIVRLPALEAGFEKHRSQLNINTLLELVDISLRSVAEDNYMITVLVIQEINKRHAAVAQKQVIAMFDKACASYDFGHRYWENTVHDQLFDHLFMEFETSALIELLDGAHGDMLNCEGGDGGDRLFVPAFKRCDNDKDFSRLTKAFFAYQDEGIEYHGLKYFKDLQNEIEAVLKKAYLKKFQKQTESRSYQAKLLALLESDNPEDIVQLIRLLGTDSLEKFFQDNDYKIFRKINSLKIPEKEVMLALDYYMEKERCYYGIADSLIQYLFPQGSRAVVEYLKTKGEAKRDFAGKITADIIQKLDGGDAPMEEIQPFREYLKSLNNMTDNDVYALEVQAIFKTILDNRYGEKPDKYLKRLEQIAPLVEGRMKIKNLDLRFNLSLLVSSGRQEEQDLLKRLCSTLFKIIPESSVAYALDPAVVSAVITNDRAFFNGLIPYIPQQTDDDLLTFNLACAYAKFKEKENMLKYIKLSLELGKTVEQFTDDEDFSYYRDDKDFLYMLKEAGKESDI